MNKFKALADKLIKSPLWTSEITLIELAQDKNQQGKVIYVDNFSKKIKCVKKQTSRYNNNDILQSYTQFFISQKSVEDLDLNKNKFVIVYNGKRYSVLQIIGLGTMNNEDALVQMVVKR